MTSDHNFMGNHTPVEFQDDQVIISIQRNIGFSGLLYLKKKAQELF